MRCEGWTRHGNAFSLGPVTWSQCENPAVVVLEVRQKEGVTTQPACMKCWKEATETPEIEILSVKPFDQEEVEENG